MSLSSCDRFSHLVLISQSPQCDSMGVQVEAVSYILAIIFLVSTVLRYNQHAIQCIQLK